MKRTGWTFVVAAATCTWASISCDGPPREVAIEDAPEEVAASYCGQMFDCSCELGQRYGDRAQCEQNIHGLMEELRRAGEEAGLIYDPRCLGAYLEEIDDAGCSASLSRSEECRPPCNPYHGSKQVGQPCSWFGASLTDCAQGLRCEGECVDPCGADASLAQLGEPCRQRACAADLLCDFETWVCEPLPGPGEPCPEQQCASGSFCDQADPNDPSARSCVAIRDDGEPCSGHTQCKSGYCPSGYCDQLPREGESCRGTLACAEGLDCSDDVCVPADAAICWADPPYGY